MTYIITYQRKDDQEEKEWNIQGDYSTLIDSITQLGKGLCTFNGEIINGIQNLSKIQIFEQNYDFESHGEYYIWVEPSQEEMEQRGISGDEYPISLTDQSGFSPYKEDITAKVFKESNISAISYENSKIIHISNNELYVKGEAFILTKNTKVYELFDILINLREIKGGNSISYKEIEDYYLSRVNESLQITDIKKTKIRNILKSKLEEIKETLTLESHIISAQNENIVFKL